MSQRLSQTRPRAGLAPAAGLVLAMTAMLLLAACAGGGASARRDEAPEAVEVALQRARQTSVFGPASDFTASRFDDVGASELYPVREPAECEVAIPRFGEDSFAVRLAALKKLRP